MQTIPDEEMLAIFADTPAQPTNPAYLLAIGRAIEKRVMEQTEFYPALEDLSRSELRNVIGRMNFTLTHYRGLVESLRKKAAA